MAPDIDWGKNIRIILDIGCKSAGFGIALLEKDVITLSLGLTNDQTDLAQVALERGIPATVGSLGSRRLPFPVVHLMLYTVVNATYHGILMVHMCFASFLSSDHNLTIYWHVEQHCVFHGLGGKLLLEINRILRPGGYFIISSKSADLESEEGMQWYNYQCIVDCTL